MSKDNNPDDNYSFSIDPNNRIGSRIRYIRSLKHISQEELGSKIELNKDRVQKYETGFRTPKMELTKKIAEALDVDILSILDPQINIPFGVIRFLLEVEQFYGLKLKKEDNKIYIYFEDDNFKKGDTNKLIRLLNSWYDKWEECHNEIFDNLTTERQWEILETYLIWAASYPTYEYKNEKEYKEYKIEHIKKNIAALEEVLHQLEEE